MGDVKPESLNTLSAAAARAVETLEERILYAVSLDANGWSVITPSTDTRVVYVSNSTGNDTKTGLSEANAVQTIAKARTLIRGGMADWMLLKRGDTFHESILQWNKSGRNAQEPMLISSYGDVNAARPLLMTGVANGFTTGRAQLNNVYVVGLRFNASSRDPSGPEFVGTGGGSYGVQMLSQSTNVVFEDDVFEKYKTNVAIQKYYGPVSNIQVRRSQILDAYNTSGNAQGLYAEGVEGLTLFENLFDHNGWNETASGAWPSTFNHNVYVHSSSSGFSFVGNISANASSHGLQARAGGIVKNNLFLGNPIGTSFGLVNGSTTKAGGVEGEVSGNVYLGNRAIGTQGRGWGLEIGNTKVGGSTIVKDNVFAHDTQRLYPAIMLSYGTGGDNATNSVGVNNVTVQNNTVYDWHQGLSTNKDFLSGGTGYKAINDVVVKDNDFQTNSTSQIVLLNHARNAGEETWLGNDYWASAASNWFSIQSTLKSFNAWTAAVEPTATALQRDYVDPTRTAASYNAAQGGPATVAGFIEKARLQSKLNWNGAYTASPVINYVRGGFAVKVTPVSDTTPPTATLTASNVLTGGATAYTFTVAYADNIALDADTLDDDDVTVIGPNGYLQLGTLLSSTETAGGGRVATYEVTPPGGSWGSGDSGAYGISLRDDAVTDTSGNAVPAGAIGGFQVSIAASPTPTPTTPAPTPTPTPTTTPPKVTSLLFVPGGDDKLLIRFDKSVAASLTLNDFIVQRTKVGFQTPLANSVMNLSYNAAINEATITFPGLTRDQLQVANWKLTLKANGITDSSGKKLDGNGDGVGGDDVVFLFKKSQTVKAGT
jgi:hypothetical protein